MAIIVGLLLCSLLSAQDSMNSQTDPTMPANQQTQPQPAPSEPAPGGVRVAPGSVIPVRLTKTVDAKKAKAGDEVDALVTQDLKSVSGEVVVPKDTKIVGHVTEAQARTKTQKESAVGIAFDHAVTKVGGVTSLPMSIQAVIAQTTQNSQNRDSGEVEPAASVPAGGMPRPDSGRPGEMGGAGTPPPMPGSYPAGGEQPGPDSTRSPASITANTQGVVGMSDYKLSTPNDGSQGSVVSSEKDNVKLESGTLMLLRVNQ